MDTPKHGVDRVLTDIELHSAGATVRHVSQFTNLVVPVNNETMPEALRDKWVKPFYMRLGSGGAEAIQSELASISAEVDLSLVETLLTYFNWRPRFVGAWLAALRGLSTLDDHIGRLLVRSDVCFAGRGYCIALARFNTDRARDYLVSYLRYYLGHPELVFDQDVAMAALVYLDQRNGRDDVAQVREAWEAFGHGRSFNELEPKGVRFGARVSRIEAVSAALWPAP